jgi:hypothetical protein
LALHILTGIFALGLIILGVALWLFFSPFDRQPKAYRWLAFTLAFSFGCDLLSVVIRLTGGQPNIGGNIYAVGFVCLYSIFFYQILRGKFILYLLFVINACFLLFVIYNAICLQGFAINSYSTTIGSIIILVLCVLYYFKLLRDLPAEQVYYLPMFWIVSAFFFAKSGKLVLYSVIQYLTAHFNDNLLRLWMAHNSLTIIENLMILYGASLQYLAIHRQQKLS